MALSAVALPAGVGRGDAAGRCQRLTSVPGAAAGLYLPSRELAHAGHELTQKILVSKVSREHDPMFARLLAAAALRHFPGFTPALVVSVPRAPGQEDRFRNIRTELARRTGARDAGAALSQLRAVPDYRRMTLAQRSAAADGRFSASDRVLGRSVLLIDDVLSAGAQASDAIRALNAAGAAAVRFVCLARSAARRAPLAERGRSCRDLIPLSGSPVGRGCHLIVGTGPVGPGCRSRTITA